MRLTKPKKTVKNNLITVIRWHVLLEKQLNFSATTQPNQTTKYIKKGNWGNYTVFWSNYIHILFILTIYYPFPPFSVRFLSSKVESDPSILIFSLVLGQTKKNCGFCCVSQKDIKNRYTSPSPERTVANIFYGFLPPPPPFHPSASFILINFTGNLFSIHLSWDKREMRWHSNRISWF